MAQSLDLTMPPVDILVAEFPERAACRSDTRSGACAGSRLPLGVVYAAGDIEFPLARGAPPPSDD